LTYNFVDEKINVKTFKRQIGRIIKYHEHFINELFIFTKTFYEH